MFFDPTVQPPVNIPESYTPPSFLGFTVPIPIDLPDGGSEGSVNADSVIQLLASTVADRKYYLLNTGISRVKLFFGGTAAVWELDVRTPLFLEPTQRSFSELITCRLAVFGWSEGDVGQVLVGVFE